MYGGGKHGRSLLVKAARAAELPAAGEGGTCTMSCTLSYTFYDFRH